MKLLISVLDNGYTLTVTHPDTVNAETNQIIPGQKERFAFETTTALWHRMSTLMPNGTTD